ncbi:hypothetical protein RN001_001064 [Aquatica leii]|uniref:UBC core domain-containing protein n=1 Tax=Aquatica leii TaxID=1421715 RepID=A0AAN7QME1_9COLE|nr:hypothetical protein RN001_001064 [Aquatica leii]
MQKQQRLLKELGKISRLPPKGISLCAKDEKLNILEANILGPENNYPFSPPSIKFLTKVYHPNIDDNGRICLDLMKMPPKGSWKPTIGLEGLLIAIRMLLESPNPDDPLMTDIAEEFKSDKEEYIRKAKLFTKEHAK